MATVIVPTEQRVVLHDVSWETYLHLLADNEERTVPRISYDRGVMELVTPSMPHDEYARTIEAIVRIVTALLNIPIRSSGGTTFRRDDLERGFEADASFYVQNEERIRGQRDVELMVDPPPDIVLEMEMSRSAMNKLPLFASMGVPEVWRCDGERVHILVLEGESYRETPRSSAVPVLTGDILTHFLTLSRTELSPAWFRAVSEWASAQQQIPDSSG